MFWNVYLRFRVGVSLYCQYLYFLIKSVFLFPINGLNSSTFRSLCQFSQFVTANGLYVLFLFYCWNDNSDMLLLSGDRQA
jgi:hypothetical protein